MDKLTIFIDMDGVIANFDKAHSDLEKSENKKVYRPDLVLDFSTFEPMPGAIDGVRKLTEMGHDLFIATTPPWDHPDAWAQKRDWILTWFPQFKKKMFLTHRKDLLKGDILIDDSAGRGQPQFEGTWMHFGKDCDWDMVVNSIRTITNLPKNL